MVLGYTKLGLTMQGPTDSIAHQANLWVATCTQATCELAANLQPAVGWYWGVLQGLRKQVRGAAVVGAHKAQQGGWLCCMAGCPVIVVRCDGTTLC